jgi:hypothetical protein
MTSQVARILLAFALTVIVALGTVGSAAAHLHPFVPEACAPASTGAGNESVGIRQAPWAPATGQFIVQHENPGRAETSSGAVAAPALFGGNPGVSVATAQCADPRDTRSTSTVRR